MSELWIALAVVIAVGLVVAVARSLQTSRRGADSAERLRADAGVDYVAARGDRRHAGMSAEDREWEQASLQRHREREAASRVPGEAEG